LKEREGVKTRKLVIMSSLLLIGKKLTPTPLFEGKRGGEDEKISDYEQFIVGKNSPPAPSL